MKTEKRFDRDRLSYVGRYVDLMFDRAFKRIFGKESNKDLLIDLLNEILPELKIRDLTFINTEQQGLALESKNSIFDVYCTTDAGTKVVVEVQVNNQHNFAERALYYASLPILDSLNAGDDYRFAPIYVVALLDFEMDRHPEGEEETYEYRYSIREDRTGKLLTDTLHFVFIEIGKFKKTEEELVTNKEKWYYCMANMYRLERMPEGMKTKVFERLFHLSDIASQPKEEQIRYIKEMRTERDFRNQLVYARDMGILEGKAEGIAEGKAEGKAEGIAEGEARGEAKGKAEGIAEGEAKGKAETALAMLANGLDIALVSKCTGLTEQQIRDLQKSKS